MDPLTVAILQSWTFDPWRLIPLLILASVYLRGWWRLTQRLPQRFTINRLVAFLGGLLALFLAMASPLDVLANLLLQVHMTQHVVLMMVAPPLILLGAPLLPLLRGLPQPVVKRGLGPLFVCPAFRRVCHYLTHPLVCWSVFIATNIAWHLPSLYELALRSEFWHAVQHCCFLGAALLFWWPVMQPWPSRPQWPRWALIPYLLLADIQNTALSAFLIFSEQVLYPAYAAVPRLWGISVLDDQAAAGVIMWIPGSLIFLVPVGLTVIRLLDVPQARSKTTVIDIPASAKVTVSRLRLLLCVFFVLLISSPEVRPAWSHHGGDVQLMEKVGPFLITTFTDKPLHVGPADVSILVQDGGSGRPILDAAVTVQLRERGDESLPIITEATRRNSTNKLLYSTQVELLNPGFWELTVAVQQQTMSAQVTGVVMVAPPRSWLLSFWPYVLMLPVMIGAGLLHWRLSQRHDPSLPLRGENSSL